MDRTSAVNHISVVQKITLYKSASLDVALSSCWNCSSACVCESRSYHEIITYKIINHFYGTSISVGRQYNINLQTKQKCGQAQHDMPIYIFALKMLFANNYD